MRLRVLINLLSTVVYAVVLWRVMEQRINLKFLYKLGKSEGQNVNSEFYYEELKRLLARIRRVRPHLKQRGSWFLLHDNARTQTATLVKRFLAEHGVTELSHPSYFPDLSPPDFFLFPKL
ncbi:hypothetical protein AVEN_159733-1 [Araneus ventricosus]|uniref:Mariner Mos1 transposase n=1 Tax=Araneus ventricosus TaxID=182803 RepID=A0A4Y2UAV9_ARAVE|nr:hypothetical protein AVEN_119483-1 [Araneus ventricosus]GBO09545.1 hypothetical protein AVEN_163932-1 [Araneus ventricosus]GBO09772.1 hypothetical protein AVEN_87465-1 [Araneus ventricosus]GBO09775.1 hypothetical protein AVEN_159733-1 [Araneus ventricosus]